jgi:hypothetical protein
MHFYLLVAGEGKIEELLDAFADYGGFGKNDNAKFDWFEIGGRFGAALRLKQPRQLRRFFGLFPGGSQSRVTKARKFEIDPDALLADPPAALLFRGQWSECPFSAQSNELKKWEADFASQFAQIPDDTLLTVVDCHD